MSTHGGSRVTSVAVLAWCGCAYCCAGKAVTVGHAVLFFAGPLFLIVTVKAIRGSITCARRVFVEKT